MINGFVVGSTFRLVDEFSPGDAADFEAGSRIERRARQGARFPFEPRQVRGAGRFDNRSCGDRPDVAMPQ
jgi:hypothetical protein